MNNNNIDEEKSFDYLYDIDNNLEMPLEASLMKDLTKLLKKNKIVIEKKTFEYGYTVFTGMLNINKENIKFDVLIYKEKILIADNCNFFKILRDKKLISKKDKFKSTTPTNNKMLLRFQKILKKYNYSLDEYTSIIQLSTIKSFIRDWETLKRFFKEALQLAYLYEMIPKSVKNNNKPK